MNKIIIGVLMLFSLLAAGFFSADWTPRGVGGGWRLPLIAIALLLSSAVWVLAWRLSATNLLAATLLLILPPALCLGASLLSESMVVWVGANQNHVEVEKIRTELSAGHLDRACELVFRDEHVSDSEMKMCWSRIEDAPDPESKWKVLELLLDKTTVGTRFISVERSQPIVPPDRQVWFVRELYTTWLEQPGALKTAESFQEAYWLLYNLSFKNGLNWSDEARSTFRNEIIPLYRKEAETRASGQRELAKPLEDFKQSLQLMLDFKNDNR